MVLNLLRNLFFLFFVISLNNKILSQCNASIGTYNVSTRFNSGPSKSINYNQAPNHFVLCLNDHLQINSNNNFTLPPSGCGGIGGCTPTFSYMVFKGTGPTVANPDNDPNYLNTLIPNANLTPVTSAGICKNNNGASSSTIHAITGQPDNKFCFLPATADNNIINLIDNNNDGCFETGAPIYVTFLNPITFNVDQKCDGTVEVTINGGYPQFFAGSYTIVNTGSGSISPSVVNAHGGKFTISGLNTGQIFSFNVTDVNGCPASYASTAQGYLGPPNADFASVGPFCDNSPAVNLNPVISGGVFSGSGIVGNQFNPVNAGCGVHNITYEVNNGNCAASVTKTVKVYCPSIDSIQVSPISCFGDCDGTIKVFDNLSDQVSINGGLSWQPINTVYTGLCSGPIQIKVKDLLGCGIDDSTYTLNAPLEITLNAVIQDVKCKDQSDGEIHLNVSGGNGNYQYSWSHNPLLNAASAVNLSHGNYSVTVTDAKGCQKTGNFILTNPSQILSLLADISDVQCKGDANGNIDVMVSGGVSPYIYNWSINANTGNQSTANNLSANTYYLTVTDNRLCELDTFFNILEPLQLLEVSQVNIQDALCHGQHNGSAEVTISGGNQPYAYLWDDQNQQTTALANGLSASNYTVIIEDANHCIIDTTITIEEPLPLNANYIFAHVACYGENSGLIKINASGGVSPYQYSWGGGIVGNTSDLAENLSPGMYHCTITDANGCTNVLSNISISSPSAPLTLNPNHDETTCIGGSDGKASVNAQGGWQPYSFEWDANTGNQTTDTAYGLSVGTYFVTVKDYWGCIKDTFVYVSEPQKITISIETDSVSCYNGSDGIAQVIPGNGVSPYTFLWDVNANNQVSDIANNLSAGTYYVTVSEANGCEHDTMVTIKEPLKITANIQVIQPVCPANNGSATILPVGGNGIFNYQWDVNTGNQITQTAINLSGQTYQVTITDQKNCVLDTFVNITEIVQLRLNPTIINASCFALNNGEILLNPSHGNAPFNYVWSANVSFFNNNHAEHLLADNYSVTVTDVDGCVKDSLIIITEPAELTSAISNITNATCADSCDGSALITPSGGTLPYQYLWQNGMAININDELCKGYNYVTITDAHGCIKKDSVLITEPAKIQIDIVSADPTCYNTINGTIIANVQGGVPGYLYSWNTGAITPNLNNLDSGKYILTVTDLNGCKMIDEANLSKPDSIRLTLTSNPSVCHNPTGDATVSLVTGGSSPYQFYWDVNAGYQNNVTATNLIDGCYTVTVTDALLCSASKEVCVWLIEGPGIDNIITKPVTCFGYSDGEATLQVSQGTLPLAYTWSIPAPNQNTLQNIPFGTYYVTVTDANNCADQATINITSPDELTVSVSALNSIQCLDSINEFTATASGGNLGAYTYFWNNGQITDVLQIPVSDNDIIFAYVQDALGCTSKNDTAKFSFYAPTNVHIIGNNKVCDQSDVLLEAEVLGGKNSDFVYEWSDGQSSSVIQAVLNTYPQNTTYQLIASAGCENDTVDFMIEYYINPKIEISANEYKGCPPFIAELNNLTLETASCSWKMGDWPEFSGSCNPLFEITEGGCYDVSVEIQTIHGCIIDSVIPCFIEVYEKPLADFEYTPETITTLDPEVTFSQTASFDSVSIIQWVWNIQEFNEIIEGEEVQYLFPENDQEYTVQLQVVNEKGCIDSIEKKIKILPVFNIFVPNTFTPNIDGLNDSFSPIINGLGDEYLFQIFNRNGQLIFETTDYENKWDGTYKGFMSSNKTVPQDTYIWKVLLRDKNSRKLQSYNGHVNVLPKNN